MYSQNIRVWQVFWSFFWPWSRLCRCNLFCYRCVRTYIYCQFSSRRSILASLNWGYIFVLSGMEDIFSTEPNSQSKNPPHTSLLNDFISTFFLTITNPMTILSFLAVFAGLGLSSIQGDYVQAGELVLGVFLGSTLWWLTLSEGVACISQKSQ